MNTKALITTLAILGSSSAAMAAPSFTVSAGVSANASFDLGARDHRDGRVDRSRDHRSPDYPSYPVYQPPAPPVVTPVVMPLPPPQDDCLTNSRVSTDASSYIGPIGAQRWGSSLTALTQPTRIDAGREFFTVGPQVGRFDTLRLQSVRGSSYINQVAVIFTNGKTQKVAINRTVDPRNPTLTIDLDGHDRQISRIVVYGETAPHASYQILAT